MMNRQQKEIIKTVGAGFGMTLIFQLFPISSEQIFGIQNYSWLPTIISTSLAILLFVTIYFCTYIGKVALIQIFKILIIITWLIPLWYAGWIYSANIQELWKWVIISSGIIGTILSALNSYRSNRHQLLHSFSYRQKSGKIDLVNGIYDLTKDSGTLKQEEKTRQDIKRWLFPFLPALGVFISSAFIHSDNDFSMIFAGLSFFIGCLVALVIGDFISIAVEIMIIEKKIGKSLSISLK